MRHHTASRIAALVAALAAIVAFGITAPAAAIEVPYATGPFSYIVGFTDPVIAVPEGSELSFTNADISGHNVASVEFGPDSNFWCAEQEYLPGRCPLFWSPVIGTGATSPVFGMEQIVAGEIYEFICEPHRSVMVGTLVALPAVPV